ncbi:MAG: hypothetical protein QM765_46730 [Myxococcales bacterium]
MSLISSIAKSFNFKIPEALSNITGKGIVDTVKNLAKVAGDTFLKPSTDGKSIFQSEINVLGMRLPNPVNALAEKLLGAAGEKIKEFGFSPEAIANLFTGTRTVKDVGEAVLPALNDRIKELGWQGRRHRDHPQRHGPGDREGRDRRRHREDHHRQGPGRRLHHRDLRRGRRLRRAGHEQVRRPDQLARQRVSRSS